MINSTAHPRLFGGILENPMLYIPTDSTELASLLDNYSHNWLEVLIFLDKVATFQGIIINKSEVAVKIRELIGELE